MAVPAAAAADHFFLDPPAQSEGLTQENILPRPIGITFTDLKDQILMKTHKVHARDYEIDVFSKRQCVPNIAVTSDDFEAAKAYNIGCQIGIMMPQIIVSCSAAVALMVAAPVGAPVGAQVPLVGAPAAVAPAPAPAVAAPAVAAPAPAPAAAPAAAAPASAAQVVALAPAVAPAVTAAKLKEMEERIMSKIDKNDKEMEKRTKEMEKRIMDKNNKAFEQMKKLMEEMKKLIETTNEKCLKRIDGLEARAFNSTAIADNHPIRPPPMNGKNPPAAFPRTISSLKSLTGNSPLLVKILTFYGLPNTGNVAEKVQRVRREYGVGITSVTTTTTSTIN